jgi:NAD(P)H-quinone oxidoreductase subunit 5
MPLLWNCSPEALLVVSGPMLLLAFLLVPKGWANHHEKQISRLAASVTVLAFTAALLCALHQAFIGRIQNVFVEWNHFQIGIYCDVLSAVMLVLVAFLGMIVTRYACRYLQGDAEQGYFLKWLCVTIGAVLTLLISGNLVLFAGAWMATSLALHKLLTFYAHRPAALVAARKKFVISRLGDLCLLAALVLVYRLFGTWEFRKLFVDAGALHASGHIPPAIIPICLLLVGAAMLKSAQFPFHSWLPDTMETPTPVSALMHAGIINAGGFLIIRLSPIVSLSPLALDTLAIVGACTAIFASLVMMTQASIKRMLAFSTIAQMGFMLLQCGLGAYSIAVLHLVAHSLYKAHAFLSSGSVVSISKTSWVPRERPAAHPGIFAASFLTSVLLTLLAAYCWGVSPLAEPGAVLLNSVLLVSMAYWLWSMWGQSITPRLVAAGLLLSGTLSGLYFGLHLGFRTLLASALPPFSDHRSLGHGVLLVTIWMLFGGMLVLQAQLPQWASRSWCRTLYVHARNGFYFNTLANRAIQAIWPVRSR